MQFFGRTARLVNLSSEVSGCNLTVSDLNPGGCPGKIVIGTWKAKRPKLVTESTVNQQVTCLKKYITV